MRNPRYARNCPGCYRIPKCPSSTSFFWADADLQIDPDVLQTPEKCFIHDLPPEILQAILENVGCENIRTLLFAQRVCKHWQLSITASPSLQRLLHFLPEEKPEDQYPGSYHGDSINPLLNEVFSKVFRHLFQPTGCSMHGWRPPPHLLKPSIALFNDLPWASTKARRMRVLHKDASWRRMLVSRRCIRKLTIVQSPSSVHEIDFSFSSTRSSSSRSGIYGGTMTMGSYYDLIIYIMKVMTIKNAGNWLLQPGRKLNLGEGPLRRSVTYELDQNGKHKGMCYGLVNFPTTFHRLEPSSDEAVLLCTSSTLLPDRHDQIKRVRSLLKWGAAEASSIPEIIHHRIEEQPE